MKSPNVRIKIVSENEAAVKEMLQAAFQNNPKGALRLTGIEIIIFLSSKIVVPIVCAFIKDALFKKYTDLQTKSDVAKRLSPKSRTSGPLKLQVNENVVCDEIAASLVGEGLSREVADKTVRQAFANVQSAVKASDSSAAK